MIPKEELYNGRSREIKAYTDLSSAIMGISCEMFEGACVNFLSLLADENPEVDNTDRFYVISSHYPGGSSLKTLKHWAQLAEKARF